MSKFMPSSFVSFLKHYNFMTVSACLCKLEWLCIFCMCKSNLLLSLELQ